MSKLFAKIKEELLEILPPTIYFFVALHIVAFIRVLMLKGTGIAPATSATVTIAALILGKAVVIADMLPFAFRKSRSCTTSPGRPRYLAVAALVHYLERLVDPYLIDRWHHVGSACAHGCGIRGHDDFGCHDRLLTFSRRLCFAIRPLDARAAPVEVHLSERTHAMRLHSLFTIATVILSLAAGNALAQDEKAKKQAEIRKVTATSLERFYKAEPKLRGEVANAPGYAVFTTYGFSFIFGGAGGKGLATDNKTKKVTYMDMAQASAGLQVGASESETLIIFKNAQALQTFIDKGWEASGGAIAQAGAGGKSAGPDAGAQVIADASYYTLTKNGLQAGVAVAGTKYWKDKELN